MLNIKKLEECVMRIMYVRLENFADVYAASGKHVVEYHFDKIEKPIIQIYGRNRCGKTVLIQKLHPFSSINLNGDERSDTPQIIGGEIGKKEIVYENHGEIYVITHIYHPTKNGHTVVSSFQKDGVEMNANGGVNTFNALVERIMGINRYTFQFVINGTQLTSFANMNSTQRKTLMNKAMGIDIYDKIHKLATEDYRYTSKLITSLTRTKEFLLRQYGSYETLRKTLDSTKLQYSQYVEQMQQYKTRLDQLTGVISSLRELQLSSELNVLQEKIMTYKTVMEQLGQYDDNLYEQLMEQQLSHSEGLHQAQSQRMLLMKDLDVLYDKKHQLEMKQQSHSRIINDYQNLEQIQQSITDKIQQMHVEELTVESSVGTFSQMLNIANAVNDTCKEITVCLNEQHLQMFCEMILKGIDVSGFLIQEGSVLMDSEKEKNVISRIRHMMSTIDGDYVSIEDCRYGNCLYRNTFEKMQQYFRSYESVNDGKFTQYDLENFEHAWKNYQTMCRLIRIEIAPEVQSLFEYKSIITRLQHGLVGIDIEMIKHNAELAAQKEHYRQLVKQLNDIETRIKDIQELMRHDTVEELPIDAFQSQIQTLQSQIQQCDQIITQEKQLLQDIDKKKMLFSSIKNINIHETQSRYDKVSKQQMQLQQSESEYSSIQQQYVQIQAQVQQIESQLKSLEDADKQYTRTVDEIENHLLMDERYKIIAEATSSTKGKPVIAIRDKIHEALNIANRLLNVIYDGEIELLKPHIDETTFTLPFRCGTNKSDDIRTGSQSESTLLSLALSLSLASVLTPYQVYLVDELDAYIDASTRDTFVLMLNEMMSILKVEQIFLISHSIQPNQYGHIVHTIDISK
jgi:DNA repair exonuclease SbcCD ATPase subunit